MGSESSHTQVVESTSPEFTERLGRLLAAWLEPGDLVLVSGELGAGKTCLVRSIIKGLGYTGLVRSPSFSIISLYETKKPVVHVDLYRVESGELLDLGISEFLEGQQHIVLVEWGERLGTVDPWSVFIAMEKPSSSFPSRQSVGILTWSNFISTRS